MSRFAQLADVLRRALGLLGMLFLMATTELHRPTNPGEPYTVSLSTGCFENRILRVTLVVHQLECLSKEERQALLGTAPATAVADSATRDALLASARHKVQLAEEYYQEKVAKLKVYERMRQAAFEDPIGS